MFENYRLKLHYGIMSKETVRPKGIYSTDDIYIYRSDKKWKTIKTQL